MSASAPGPPPGLHSKLRTHYEKAPMANPRCTRFMRALFLFQSVTQLYVTLTYLVPFVFDGFDPRIIYCFKVLVTYIFFVSLANWLSIICYSSVYVPTRDRPDIDANPFQGRSPPERFGTNLSLHKDRHLGNGHAYSGQVHVDMESDCNSNNWSSGANHYPHPHSRDDVSEKGGMPWHFCQFCDMTVPPRAHHCKFCERCILRRDHHCHLVGVCIGHWNQRYFVVLAAYSMLVGYVGGYLTLTYLRLHHQPGDGWVDYVLPVAVVQLLFGKMSGLKVLLIFHAYMLCVFGPLSNMYFLSQLSMIAFGKTLHEVAKKTKLKITSSVDENLRLVFGQYWLINFLFPAQILFKQDNDGTRFDGVKLLPDKASDSTDDRGGKRATD